MKEANWMLLTGIFIVLIWIGISVSKDFREVNDNLQVLIECSQEVDR